MRTEQYESLTPTEREVLRRLGRGSRAGEIAAQLDRSVSTVNNHLQSARTKLGVSDSLSAARALLAFERTGQNVPGQGMPMAETAEAGPDWTSHDPETWSPEMPDGERSTHCADARPDAGPLRPANGGERDAGWSVWRKVGTILCLTLLALACVALAPAMAETWQLVINLIYPLEH